MAPLPSPHMPCLMSYPVDQLHNRNRRTFWRLFSGFFSPWRAILRHGFGPPTVSDMLIPIWICRDRYGDKPRLNSPAVARDQVNIQSPRQHADCRGEKKKQNRTGTKKKSYYRMERLLRLVPPCALPARGRREADKITATHKGWRDLSIEIPAKEPEAHRPQIEVVKANDTMRAWEASFRMPSPNLPREPLEKTMCEAFRTVFPDFASAGTCQT